MNLKNFTNRKFVILKQDASVFHAVRAMCENQVGCVLIGDGEGNAVGVLTDRDLVCRWAGEHQGKDVTIDRIMSREVVSADEESSLTEVLERMERHGIRRIPITKKLPNGNLRFTGIASLDDFIAAQYVRPGQLSRIVRHQLGRRMEFLDRPPQTARSRTRSEAHHQQSLHEFYSKIQSSIGLSGEQVPPLIQYLLGVLSMRITYTAATHFMAQLPELIREPLLRLPSGPDRSYTARNLIEEMSSRFQMSENEATEVFQRFISGLRAVVGVHTLEHLKAQLPTDFHPYFEARQEPAHEKATANPGPWKNIISFADRTQAADLLVERLAQYRGQNPLILGIPRGSIPMAKRIAEKLDGDLDVVLVHKIGAPGNPEFAIGSVSEFGTVYRSDAVRAYGIPDNYVETSAQNEIERLRDKRQSYSPIRAPLNPSGRTVIIVDDGIATGSTMLAAVRAVRSQNPKEVIVASPVASQEAAELLRKEADQFVTIGTPEEFFSISQFYDDFPQVRDEEVLQALTEARKHQAA